MVDAMQDLVERGPQATPYESAAFALHRRLVSYPGHHEGAPDQRQTSSVAGEKADPRYDLACLARKSRCFSRSIEALRCAVKLFVAAWNRCQFHKRTYLTYPCHVIQFVRSWT